MVPMMSATATESAGDGEVVIDLAHGLGEGPAVGEVHERAVDRVEQRHAGGEEHRQAEDRVPRQPRAGRAGGQEEQRDLGRGVEAQAEEDAQRVHLPRLADRPREAPEEAVHEPARLQQVLELVLGGPAAHVAEDAHDAHEDDEVQRRDHVQEGPRDARPDRGR